MAEAVAASWYRRGPGLAEGSARARAFLVRPEVAAAAIAVIPVLVAIACAINGHWIPIGDNALMEIRSRDVFSIAHFPLLGTASSASANADAILNHPGPLLFDLLAIPVALFGGVGVAIGVGLINALAVIGCAVAGFRLAGRTGSLLATAAAAFLAWTMGSAMLVEPWNPHVLMLPYLLLLLLAAAVAAGDALMVAPLLAVGSLCMQTHLSYAVIVPMLTVAAGAGLALVHRRRWRLDPSCRSGDTARLRRRLSIAAGVGVLAWLQPLWQQISKGGDGNLTNLATNSSGDEPKIGLTLGARLIASELAVPSRWGRWSFSSAIPATGYNADGETVDPRGVPGTALAALLLTALAGVLLTLAARAYRRERRPQLMLLIVMATAVFAGVATLTILPIGPLGLRPHQMRWLWALTPFAFVAVSAQIGERHRRIVGGVAMAAVGVLAIANLATFVQRAGPNSETSAVPVVRDVAGQLQSYAPAGRVVFDPVGSRFAEPYSSPVLAALQRAGVDWSVREGFLVGQYGEGRRANGSEQTRVFITEGRAALAPPTAATTIAFSSPLTPDEIDRLVTGERDLVEVIAAYGLTLTDRGRARAAAGAYALSLATIDNAAANAQALVDFGVAADLVADGGLVFGSEFAELFETTSRLRRTVTTTTVAVFAAPTGTPDAPGAPDAPTGADPAP